MATTKRSTVIGTVVDTLTTETGWTEDFPIQGGLHIYNNELKAHIDGQIVTVYPQASGGTTEVINISSAQILAMGTTPIELLPAAGVNKYYDVEKVILEYTFNTTAYTLPANDDLAVVFNSSYQGQIVRYLINSSEDTSAITKPSTSTVEQSVATGGVFLSSYAQKTNESLLLTFFSGGDPTLGDGTLRAIVTYTLRTFGA